MSRAHRRSRRKASALAPLGVAVAGLVACIVGCIPSLGPGDALIGADRILAVRADPAEAAPGTVVTFTAFVASPEGSVLDAGIGWSFCTAPKPLTEDNVVSNACLASSSLVGLGTGPTVTAALPTNACSLFGPDTPAPGFRPREPDGTGGYYQPLRVDLATTDTAFELARLHCDLPSASATAASAFAAAYVLNQNPALLPLTASRAAGGAPVDLGAVPAATRVTLAASWDAASAESFAHFDPSSQAVTMQREAMQVAWYTSGGTLDTESTGRAASDLATTTDDGWSTPSTPGVVHLWTVLRDSRGGVDVAEIDATVVD